MTLDERHTAELRRVLAQMEAGAPLAPDLEENRIVAPVPGKTLKPAAFALGMAVVLAVFVPLALIPDRPPVQSGGPGTSPPAGPMTTLADPEPTTTLGPSNGPTAAGPWDVTETPARIDALTVHEDRFYAITGGAVLASEDGVSWTTVGTLPEEAVVLELVSHDGILVGHGGTVVDAPTGRDWTDTVWISTDGGTTWSPTLVGERVRRVASTPFGLVATGWVDLDPVGAQLPRAAALWTSSDGIDWTLAWRAEGDTDVSSTADAVVWADGLVVIGSQGPAPFDEGAGHPSDPVWERVAWTGATLADLAPAGSVNVAGFFTDVATTDLGHFALTYGFDPAAKDSSAAWQSGDGVHWTDIRVGTGWQHVSVAADGTTVVIGGDTLQSGQPRQPKVWYTVDGQTWVEMDTSMITAGLALRAVAIHDGELVVALDGPVTGFLYRLTP